MPTETPTEEFSKCWQAAGTHLQQEADKAELTLNWIKANLEPPFLEHISFRLKNQLFFVRIEDVDGNLVSPGRPDGVKNIADGCNGIPCTLWMKNSQSGWRAASPGWSLQHFSDRSPINPVTLCSDRPVNMTDWELHDFAVQIVRQHLEKEGRQIISSQGDPQVNPSLWFVGDDGPEWVVVRAVRYPERGASPPNNWAEIAASCAYLSREGNFASVAVASAHEKFEGPPTPLWRGGPMHVGFAGLEKRN